MCRYLTLHIYKYAIGLHINTIYVLVFYFIYLAHLFKIKEEKKRHITQNVAYNWTQLFYGRIFLLFNCFAWLFYSVAIQVGLQQNSCTPNWCPSKKTAVLIQRVRGKSVIMGVNPTLLPISVLLNKEPAILSTVIDFIFVHISYFM